MIILNLVANNVGNLQIVKQWAVDLVGSPIGKSQSNQLLDTCQWDVEFDDGTTDQYFANAIAENLYSHIVNGGRDSEKNQQLSKRK